MEMLSFRRLGAALALAVLAAPLAAEVQVKSIAWTDGPKPRLLVDFSAEPDYRISRTEDRLNIEVADASPAVKLVQPPAGHPAAARIGSMPGKARHSLNLLVQMKTGMVPKFLSRKTAEGVRLVVQWPEAAAEKPAGSAIKAVEPKAAKTASVGPANPILVAIDAGHGGKDTGAIGPSGLQEKDVTLAIARRLAALVNAEPGMRPILIRNGDHFVDLHERASIARAAKADLFVSLHADAYEDDNVRGSSIFTLSETGASSEAARTLADHENAASVAGVELQDKNPVLASVLVDLSKSATLEASDLAAVNVLRELKKSFPVHCDGVQKAGFVVLKSLDVPSMLVETAFISNPAEEKNLASPEHQDRLARAVFQGIRAYFAEARGNSPPERVAKNP